MASDTAPASKQGLQPGEMVGVAAMAIAVKPRTGNDQ